MSHSFRCEVPTKSGKPCKNIVGKVGQRCHIHKKGKKVIKENPKRREIMDKISDLEFELDRTETDIYEKDWGADLEDQLEIFRIEKEIEKLRERL